MQTISGDAAECQIEIMSVARAYSRRHDLALAGLTLFDAPLGTANRVEFHDATLRIRLGTIQYCVNLVNADGRICEGILPHNEPVYFHAPKFVPLTHDEWKAGPPPEKIALLRCLLTSRTLLRCSQIEHIDW